MRSRWTDTIGIAKLLGVSQATAYRYLALIAEEEDVRLPQP
jgi:predicted transcriptional regulator